MVVGCGPNVAVPEDTTEGGGTQGSGSTDATGSTSTSGPDPTTTSASSSGPIASTGENGESSSGFVSPFECPPPPFQPQCDVGAQDCPEDGFRCIPWPPVDPDSAACTPEHDEPVPRFGDCKPDDATCSDPCATGDYCWWSVEVDAGMCLRPCETDGDDLGCEKGEHCPSCIRCVQDHCFPACDPFAPDCPERFPKCLDVEGAFTCVASEDGTTAVGQWCAFPNACQPGHVCASELYTGCVDIGPGGCCTQLCNLDDADPGCPSPGWTCVPYFLPTQTPPGQGHVGVCSIAG